MDRAGQVALITGAGRGIGRAVAVLLGQRGVRCVLTARTPEGVDETARLVRATGGTAEVIVADLAAPETADRLVAETVARCGGLDILINNAGLLLVKTFAETSLDEFDELMAVNLRAPFALTKAALPHLERSAAAVIINIGSAAGKRFYPGQSVYCATKHGLLGWSKVLASELRPKGIRVHAINPGGVATEMNFRQRPDWAPDELMAPEDIAAAVGFLLDLSPRATVDELPMRRIAAEPIWG